MAPIAGEDYPGSYAELRAWFDEDWKCLDYLDWMRWPQGFVCPRCARAGGWRGSDGRRRCAGCDRRVSATAGTIFDSTRTPLTYDQLRKAGRTRSAPPLPPAARALPRSLDLGHVGLPWRSSDRA